MSVRTRSQAYAMRQLLLGQAYEMRQCLLGQGHKRMRCADVC